MNELVWMSLAPALRSLEVVTQLLMAGALLFILWEVMILLASLISLQPPRPARRRGS
jgi:hypothetical protein